MGWNDRIYRPYYTSFYGSGHPEQFLEKLLREYDLDGVWENCVIFGFSSCYCPGCRDSIREKQWTERMPDSRRKFIVI